MRILGECLTGSLAMMMKDIIQLKYQQISKNLVKNHLQRHIPGEMTVNNSYKKIYKKEFFFNQIK